MNRYLSFSQYFKSQNLGKVYKISIDAGFKCPGRCAYCSEWGSLASYQRENILKNNNSIEARKVSIKNQINKSINFFIKKRKVDNLYLYLQANSNTFGTVEELREIYYYALNCYDFKGIIIGTRPDLIDDSKIKLLKELNEKYDLWIELGLQSANNKTLKIINRNHTYEQFEQTVIKLSQNNIKVGTHIIVGLPGENLSDNINTIKKVSTLPIKSIKFHYLYVLKNTPLLSLYEKGYFKPVSSKYYLNTIIELIKYLRKDIAIFRLFSDPEPDSIAPFFKLKKIEMINLFQRELKNQDIYQGCKYEKN